MLRSLEKLALRRLPKGSFHYFWRLSEPDSLERMMHDGLEQTAAYMDRCAAQERHLVIFDRRAGKWEDKVFHRTERVGKGDMHVWGM